MMHSFNEKKICLASDNWSAAHPSVMQSVMDANCDFAPSYGSDEWTVKAQKIIQDTFQAACKVFIVPTGTGANILGLKLACRRHESVICTDIAHIHYQESGASESIIGCKLLTVPHQNGKVAAEHLIRKLKKERAFGKHSTSPRVLSLTQPTEVGTVYTLDELAALSAICKEENLLLHLDGSRLYNAAVFLNVSLHEIVRASQTDILSLGGTKNGLMGAEALLIFNEQLMEGSDHIHKQTLQLMSKMRYLSAQFLPFFQNGLWGKLALHANEMAKKMASLVEKTPHLSLSYPVETNQIFFTLPPAWIPLLQEGIYCYVWDQEKSEMRWITSWNTKEADIENIQSILQKISKQS